VNGSAHLTGGQPRDTAGGTRAHLYWVWCNLHYAWKAQANWGWLTLAVALAVVFLLLLGDAFRPPGAPRSTADLAYLMEAFLPLGLALLLARVPALDREIGAHELHLTWPFPPQMHLLRLTTVPALAWAAAGALLLLGAQLFYAPMDLRQALDMALYPSLGLGGVALGGSALARHQVGGVATASLWWGVDLLKPGDLHRWGHLFPYARPLPDADPARLHLQVLAVGLVGLALSLWLAGRRERWVTGTPPAE